MIEAIRQAALEHGFARVFLLPHARLEAWKKQAQKTGFGEELYSDTKEAYPLSSCVALLVYPYAPYEREERISAYYVNSNAAYHAAKALALKLNKKGIKSEYARVPLRALALQNKIGVVGKNGLLRMEPYGSRMVLEALALYDCPPEEPQKRESAPACPAHCTACMRACPSAAIDENGLNVARCMRAHMENALRADEIKEKLSWHIGCEACMFACPFNARVASAAPSQKEREAFSLKRLIEGDTKEARSFVGKNITAGGKLTAEAIVFAAKQGFFEGEIRASLSSPFEAVRDAARFALEKYFKNDGVC